MPSRLGTGDDEPWICRRVSCPAGRAGTVRTSFRCSVISSRPATARCCCRDVRSSRRSIFVTQRRHRTNNLLRPERSTASFVAAPGRDPTSWREVPTMQILIASSIAAAMLFAVPQLALAQAQPGASQNAQFCLKRGSANPSCMYQTMAACQQAKGTDASAQCMSKNSGRPDDWTGQREPGRASEHTGAGAQRPEVRDAQSSQFIARASDRLACVVCRASLMVTLYRQVIGFSQFGTLPKSSG